MKPINLPDYEAKTDFTSIDPVDGRYYSPAMAKYLSEESRIRYQAYVESALAYALSEYGLCSKEIADQIASSCEKVTAAAVSEEESLTHHDVKALINVIKSNLSDEAKPYVHFGATSYDIVSTALSLELRDAVSEVILPNLLNLEKTLLSLVDKYSETVQIGRTHGQHAVPITFGFNVAGYVSRLGQNIEMLRLVNSGLRGKFSGAVGAYNALSIFVDDPIAFERTILGYLKIDAAEYSSQIVPSEYYVRLIDELVITSGIMANIAQDMRHLQRSEIAEVREAFSEGQTGSSTMPHKRNPWNFENIISLTKQVTSQSVNANLNLVSEHQRDLTDSASARFYGVTLALVGHMAERLNKVMSKLEVDEENMKRNLHLSSGAIAAEPLYLLLEKYGHISGHEVSKKLAVKALDLNKSLNEVAENSEEIREYYAKFTDREKQLIEEPEKYYTGLSSEKAKSIASLWHETLGI